MKPVSIRLPDDISRRLDEELSTLEVDRQLSASEQIAVDRAAAAIVQDIFFDTKHPRSDMLAIQDALIRLQTAEGSPVILLENLPQRARPFFLGLFSNLLSDDRSIVPQNMVKVEADKIDLHQDDVFNSTRKKLTRGLLCINPGEKARPTIFVSPDEVLHAHACLKLDLPILADREMIEAAGKWGAFCQIRDEFAEQLRTISVVPLGTSDGGNYVAVPEAFLQDNPNYVEGGEAQRYITCWPDREEQSLHDSIPNPEDFELFTTYTKTLEMLRTAASEQSLASLRKNTCVIWNDALVCHDRGQLIGEAPEISSGERALLSCDAHSGFAGKLCSLERAIGSPLGLVSEGYLQSRCAQKQTPAIAAE